MTKRIHSKELKFKVAIDAIKGDLTITQIMSQYGVAESLVHKWRKQVLDQGSNLFGSQGIEGSPHHHEHQIKHMHAKIGELTLANDFLEQALFKSGKRSAGK
jgi:transposase